ncbi:MAG: isopenicillin N synthase family oxygenase [Pseudobdellovibrionaceae bacterium]|nr:isopenicillin N synthase family oxygenase [Bdellovibrionales bacterium]USN47232.1 MAG: isopenicillin N synthase family oxygenase [Pseudobdellovibrionaceae bacterium]
MTASTHADYLTQVPTLSLKQYIDGDVNQRQEFTADLFRGLRQFGFIILKDHPIQQTLLDTAYEKSRVLFSLPESKKLEFLCHEGGGQRGYTPFGKEHAKDSTVADLKEFWHVGRDLNPGETYYDQYPKNIWPEEILGFRKTFSQLYSALDDVGRIMLQALTPALDLPSDYFDRLTLNGNSILRLLHYPPIPEGADPHAVRAAAHEDINLITILVSASASGLELLDRQGQWLPVEAEAGQLIVDAGDMLSRITNEVIPSTTHRVVNPQDGQNVSRYSMPFFMHPHPEATLSCIPSCVGTGAKYPDISSQNFLMQRLREIGLI